MLNCSLTAVFNMLLCTPCNTRLFHNYSIFAAVNLVSSWIIAAVLLVQFVGIFVVVFIQILETLFTTVRVRTVSKAIHCCAHSLPALDDKTCWAGLTSWTATFYFVLHLSSFFKIWFSVLFIFSSFLFCFRGCVFSPFFWRLIETAACSVWISFYFLFFYVQFQYTFQV